MRVLVIGAGGVGTAFAKTAARWGLFEFVAMADNDVIRAQRAIAGSGDRFAAFKLDAGNQQEIVGLIESQRVDAVLNALDPRFVMSVFNAAFSAGVTYLDMAMSLSRPHPTDPYRLPGIKLGDEQFAQAARWEEQGLLALCGIGVEPGLSDVFARHAADTMFSSIDEVGVRDGSNLVIEGYEFAPSFSIWTTLEECLNPPVVWERGKEWFTTECFSEPETFIFPAGIGPVECVNVEHEEVLLIPRWIDANRVTFKYGLGDEFISVLTAIHKLGLDSTTPIRVGDVEVSPRDVVAGCLPDPAQLGDRMSGSTCAGTWVTGTGTAGGPRDVYLHHVVDNAWCMSEFDSQAVVWQTAMNPVMALELLESGGWEGQGVIGPEALPPAPFLDLLNSHGTPWYVEERTPSGP